VHQRDKPKNEREPKAIYNDNVQEQQVKGSSKKERKGGREEGSGGGEREKHKRRRGKEGAERRDDNHDRSNRSGSGSHYQSTLLSSNRHTKTDKRNECTYVRIFRVKNNNK
jgi:hypothetical protein